MTLLPPTSSTAPPLPDQEQLLIETTTRRRWAVVGLLFLASMINYFDRETLSFALPYIASDFHLDAVEKGLILSAFFWSYALMQVPMGILADRFDLRWVYAGAFSLWSFAQGLTGVAGTFGLLIAFRILLGIGEAIYLPGGTKAVSLLFRPAERGLPSGLFDSGTRTGLVLESLLIPPMIKYWGWRTTFVVIGVAALLWLIPWLSVTPRPFRSARGPAATRMRPSVVAIAQRFPMAVGACAGLLAGIASGAGLHDRSGQHRHRHRRRRRRGAPLFSARSVERTAAGASPRALDARAQSLRDVPRVLLFRLLLVHADALASRLPHDPAALRHREDGLPRRLALPRLWREPASWGLDCRQLGPAGLG